MFEIVIKDRSGFSNSALKDMVLYPNKDEAKTEMKKIIKDNDGARGFFSYTARQFRISADGVENDLTNLTNRILYRRRR